MKTKGLIFLAVTVLVVTTFIAQSKSNSIEFRSYLGAGFVGVFLSGFAAINDELGANLAMLVILIALLHNGPVALGYVKTATQTTARQPQPKVRNA